MKLYLKVLKKYADCKGRASREEYWTFMIVTVLIGMLLNMLTANTNQNVLLNIYSMATLIPQFAVSIRRMHDVGENGWWSIVPIVGFLYTFRPSQQGDNKYGKQPKSSVD